MQENSVTVPPVLLNRILGGLYHRLGALPNTHEGACSRARGLRRARGTPTPPFCSGGGGHPSIHPPVCRSLHLKTPMPFPIPSAPFKAPLSRPASSFPPPHLLLSAWVFFARRNTSKCLGSAGFCLPRTPPSRRGCRRGRGHRGIGTGSRRCPAPGGERCPRQRGTPTRSPWQPPGACETGSWRGTGHRGGCGRMDPRRIRPLGFAFFAEVGFCGQNHQHRAIKLGLEQAKSSISWFS